MGEHVNGQKVKLSIPDTADTETGSLNVVAPDHIRAAVVHAPVPCTGAMLSRRPQDGFVAKIVERTIGIAVACGKNR